MFSFLLTNFIENSLFLLSRLVLVGLPVVEEGVEDVKVFAVGEVRLGQLGALFKVMPYIILVLKLSLDRSLTFFSALQFSLASLKVHVTLLMQSSASL